MMLEDFAPTGCESLLHSDCVKAMAVRSWLPLPFLGLQYDAQGSPFCLPLFCLFELLIVFLSWDTRYINIYIDDAGTSYGM